MEKRRDIPRSTIQTHTIPAFSFWSLSLSLSLCLNFRKKIENLGEYDMTCCLLSLWVSVFLRRNRISLQTQKGSLKRTWKLRNLTWPPKDLSSLCLFFLFLFFLFLIYLFFLCFVFVHSVSVRICVILCSVRSFPII